MKLKLLFLFDIFFLFGVNEMNSQTFIFETVLQGDFYSQVIDFDASSRNDYLYRDMMNFFNSDNGGLSWDTLKTKYQFNSHVKPTSLSMPNSNTLILLYDSIDANNKTHTILCKSYDKGQSWDYETTEKQRKFIKMNHDGMGIWYQDSVKFTTDFFKTSSNLNLPDTFSLKSIDLTDNVIKFICTNKFNYFYFVRTTDFGQTWNSHEIGYISHGYASLFFKTKDLGWMLKNYSQADELGNFKYGFTVLKTTNGGTDWLIQSESDTSNNRTANTIGISDDNTLIIGLLADYLFLSTDGGNDWKRINIDFFNIIKITFFGKNYGIIQNGSYKYLYKFKIDSLNNVTDFEETNYFSISPNPATDFLEISVGANGRSPLLDIEVFNVFGLKVLSTSPQPSPFLEREEPPRLTSSATPQEGNLRLDVSGLPPGVYFVKIGEKVGKFVKI